MAGRRGRVRSTKYTYGCNFNGRRKRRYTSTSRAYAELLRIAEEQRGQGWPEDKIVKDYYRCGKCYGYHLTSLPPGYSPGDDRPKTEAQGGHDSSRMDASS